MLEIGTGSAYQAAVLGELTNEVYSIEIVAPLADRARETLTALGYRHVRVRTGNGYLGWPEHAPFDRIIVTAAPAEIPPALVEQLKVGGVMAIPVGTTEQDLRILRKTDRGMETVGTLPVRFVPMTASRADDRPSGDRIALARRQLAVHSLKRCVIGPTRPSPIGRPSMRVTAASSPIVPVQNASSAR